jgi:hypothetical protein
VPSEKSIWRHQGLDLREAFPDDLFGLHRESSTLLISEAEPLPAELLPQGSIFRLDIFDHVLLVSIDPASEEQHQKLQRPIIHRSELGPGHDRRNGPKSPIQ